MKLIKAIYQKGVHQQTIQYFHPEVYGKKALTKNTIGYFNHQKRKKIMKKSTILCSVLILLSAVIITGCERENQERESHGAIKVNARLVGIDSVSSARTEDKVLFVNIKE